MELRKVIALRGPNLWARCPVLEAAAYLPAFGGEPVAAAAVQRLAAWLPVLADPADLDRADSLLELLQQGLPVADLLMRLALRLQNMASARTAVSQGFARPEGTAHCWLIGVEFEEEALARLALSTSWEMCRAALEGQPLDAVEERVRLRAFVDRYCLGPSTRAIVTAARRRGIPYRRLNDRSLVQFGHGVQQRRIFTAETDRTSNIAEGIAQDKELTKTLLRAVGVPVPAGRLVSGPEDAWQAAGEIGLPVVVKPRDANHGRGVALNLTERHQVQAAYAQAALEGEGVLVEQWIRGVEHRLLVIGGRMVAASRGEPEQVVGDGRSTVSELVDRLNLDPRRGLDFSSPLGKVEIDPLALLTLEQQGLLPDSVPAAGLNVIIHPNGDYTTDETDEVHPEIAEQAVLAAEVVGLDVAGIDLIARDISRPLAEQRGVVIEVNAGPGLNMHLHPQHGKPRPVGELLVDRLYPPAKYPQGNPGRIPIAICCGDGAASAEMLARMLQAAGEFVGLSTPRGTLAGQRELTGLTGSLSDRQRDLLMHPRLTAVVLETSASAIAAQGLPVEICSVAVIGASSPNEDAAPSHVIAKTVDHRGALILWADNPIGQELAASARAPVVWLSEDESQQQILLAKSGVGRAVFLRDNRVWLAHAGRELPIPTGTEILRREVVPELFAGFGWRPLLAAIAAAWGLGVSEEKLLSVQELALQEILERYYSGQGG